MIFGVFWGVKVYMLWCEVSVEGSLAASFSIEYTVCASPKVSKYAQYSAKMAHLTVFSPVFVQILGLGAILCVIPYVCSLYNLYKG